LAIVGVAFSYIAFVVFAVKRLHDAEMSGWFGLIGFIPIVNYVFFFYLVFKKGTIGDNKYGTDPKIPFNQAS